MTLPFMQLQQQKILCQHLVPAPFTCSTILHKFSIDHDITIANVATELFCREVFIDNSPSVVYVVVVGVI